jgi:t-SNARE complex subunit (syntaxin)
MSSSTGSLESASASLGGPNDTSVLRAKIEGHERDALNLQSEIESGIRKLRVSLVAGADHTAQRQLKRLDDQYADARERLSRVLGDSRLRRRQYVPLETPAASQQPKQRNGGVTSTSSSSQVVTKQQLELLSLDEVDAAIIQERKEEALAIARASSDLHKTQQDLSALVTDQGESIKVVEANVDKAVEKVAAGTQVLTEAQAYQNSYRWKCAAAWALIAAIAIAVGLVVGLKIKPGIV